MLSAHDLIGKNNYTLFTDPMIQKIQEMEQRILKGEKITNHEIVIPGTKGKRKGFFQEALYIRRIVQFQE